MTSSPSHSSGHTARTKQTREPAFRGMSRHNASAEGAEISTGFLDEDASSLLSQSYPVSKSIISSGNNIPYAPGRGLTTRQRTLLEPTSGCEKTDSRHNVRPLLRGSYSNLSSKSHSKGGVDAVKQQSNNPFRLAANSNPSSSTKDTKAPRTIAPTVTGLSKRRVPQNKNLPFYQSTTRATKPKPKAGERSRGNKGRQKPLTHTTGIKEDSIHQAGAEATTSCALSEEETRELWDEVFGSRKTFSSAESLSCPTLSTTSSPSPSEMPLPVFAQETCASILSDSYGITEPDSETTRISKQWWQEKGTLWEKMTADSPNKPVTTLLGTHRSRQKTEAADIQRRPPQTISPNSINEHNQWNFKKSAIAFDKLKPRFLPCYVFLELRNLLLKLHPKEEASPRQVLRLNDPKLYSKHDTIWKAQWCELSALGGNPQTALIRYNTIKTTGSCDAMPKSTVARSLNQQSRPPSTSSRHSIPPNTWPSPTKIPPNANRCPEGHFDMSFWIAATQFEYPIRQIERHVFVSPFDETCPYLSIVIADLESTVSAADRARYVKNKLAFKACTHLYNRWLLKDKSLKVPASAQSSCEAAEKGPNTDTILHFGITIVDDMYEVYAFEPRDESGQWEGCLARNIAEGQLGVGQTLIDFIETLQVIQCWAQTTFTASIAEDIERCIKA